MNILKINCSEILFKQEIECSNCGCRLVFSQFSHFCNVSRDNDFIHNDVPTEATD